MINSAWRSLLGESSATFKAQERLDKGKFEDAIERDCISGKITLTKDVCRFTKKIS